MFLLDTGGLPTLIFLQSLVQEKEGPKMLFSSLGVSNSVFCPVVAAGRDLGDKATHLPWDSVIEEVLRWQLLY